MKKLFPAVLLLITAVTAVAADITGRVTDAKGESLMQSSVRLLKPDSAFVAGTAADLDGNFRLSGVAPGQYLLETTYVGYSPKYTAATVGKSDVALKPIALAEETKLLGEVTVTGVKTPIKVSTDTVEFNADSYLTRPNAVVEDLLKRLPGVEVSADGSITANGQSITKILIDGKEFFGDDPKVASKNLPAEMVNKVQVVNRKSDEARLTGVDDGEEEVVINLSVKKDMKNGWFGNIEGGYGTDSRYTGNFNVSRFKNDNQFTLLGNFNNINQLGFTDGNGSRFRRFGGDDGITTSQALGLNFTISGSEKLKAGGNIMYSHTDRDAYSHSERRYIFPDSTSYTSSRSWNREKGHNVRGDFRVLWTPDSFNTLEIRPRFSFNFTRPRSMSNGQTNAGDAAMSLVNKTENTSRSRGDSYEAAARLIYTHNFASRRGRSFSVMLNYRFSDVREDEWTRSINRFFLVDDQDDDYSQYLDNHTWNNNIRARVTWKEPLGDPSRGNYLTFAYSMNYRWNNADKLVYDEDPETGAHTYDPELSNRFRNNFFSQDIRVGYQKVTATTNAEAGISLVPSMSMSTNLTDDGKSIPRRTTWNVAPFLRYRYKLGKNRSIQARYRGWASEPSLTQLQPVADVSDPLRVIQGNPNLDPSFTHFLMIRFQDFDPEAQRSIMAMAHFDLTQNSIVSRTTYNDETGGQLTTYENVNGVWSGRAMCIFSMPLRNKNWTFTNHLFTDFNRSVGFSNDHRNATLTMRINERPSIAFRPGSLEIEASPFYAIQTSRSSIRTLSSGTTHQFGGNMYATWYSQFGLSVSTDLNYTANRGYSDGYNTNTWMWNASVSYQFLRNREATVTVKVNDILGQNKNIRRNVTAAYIEDLDYNALTRYAMVTFTYRFNTFGKGKQPSDSGNFMFPGGGPMGPPPGGHRPH